MALHATRTADRQVGAAPTAEAGWELAAPAALEHLGIGLVVCDWAYRVRSASVLGRALLRVFAGAGAGALLPAALRTAAEDCAAAGPRAFAVRVDAPVHGLAVSVTATQSRGSGGNWIVTLRREIVRDDLVLGRLRERYGTSVRDAQLIALLRRGCRNRDIAAELLGLTLGTVKSYLHRLFERTGVSSRTELLALVERVRLGFE